MRMGGRVAELLDLRRRCPPGPANDLVGNTELARKMVREPGMSEPRSAMAWGSRARCSSARTSCTPATTRSDTSRVIDDEVERILREQEERAVEVLSRHRAGLDGESRRAARGGAA